MKILIIEDEPKTALYLQKGLRENGFSADISNDGQDGWFNISQQPYDLVLLDIMLPKVDGWTIINRIRKENSSLPILVLSARDAVQDKVKGFNLGADDYLVKPFAFSELLARIQSLLKRGQIVQEPLIYKIEDLEINLRTGRASRGGESIQLTAKEFSLLALLAQHKGELLSKTVIIDRIWDINFDNNSNVVEVMIRRLRQKVDAPYLTKLIHTVRGIGYVMETR